MALIWSDVLSVAVGIDDEWVEVDSIALGVDGEWVLVSTDAFGYNTPNPGPTASTYGTATYGTGTYS